MNSDGLSHEEIQESLLQSLREWAADPQIGDIIYNPRTGQSAVVVDIHEAVTVRVVEDDLSWWARLARWFCRVVLRWPYKPEPFVYTGDCLYIGSTREGEW